MARGRKPYKNIPGTQESMTLMTNEAAPAVDYENRSRQTLNREGDEDRLSRDLDMRSRGNFYDVPEFDDFDYQSMDGRKLQLVAPPARVDPKHGKMHQRWVAFHNSNGFRVQEMREKGYTVRDPRTVPPSFKGFTEQWEGFDVIMVAGEHILMETPQFHHERLQRAKHENNVNKIRDIQNTHGQIVRDGLVIEQRDRVASFTEEHFVKASDYSNGGGDVSFAD